MAYFIAALALITMLKISTSEAVKVAAFNIQVLGQTKISKSSVTDTLVKIINRYDIILIQEIRDSRGNAIKKLLKKVNNFTEDDSDDYEMVISGRLGRSVSKEQYAFFYRKNNATVKDSYTYTDKNDDFEREPYIVQFHIPSAAVSDLVFIAIHTKPNDAVSETDKLVDVYDDVVTKWKTNDIVILGDLNAACTYVRERDWGKIRLANDKRFWWLIDDCHDTTVEGSRCAYDRIIATGEYLLKNIVAGSPGLFDFQKAYGLDKQEAGDVSDHFPVEFQLKQAGWKEQETVDYVVSSVLPSNIAGRDVEDVVGKNIVIPRVTLYKKSGGVARIIMLNATKTITSAIACVQMLQRKFDKFMGHNQIDQVENYLMTLESETDKFPYQVFSMYKNVVDVKLIWDIESFPITCQLVISKYL